MALHPLARQFDSVAEAYERGRPEHVPAVVGAICAELGLRPGDPVLDLGAGTGKLTRPLLAAGLDVTAVEPQGAMRQALLASVGPERALEGVAEAIPLADGAVAAVTVADAFHWFDAERAPAEIARVLAPGGGIAVLTAVPDWRGASWAHEVGELISRARGEHPHFDGPPWQQALERAGGWGVPWEVRVTSFQPADAVRTLDWVASFSWVAALPEAGREDLLSRAAALIEAGTTPEQMRVHVTIGLVKRD